MTESEKAKNKQSQDKKTKDQGQIPPTYMLSEEEIAKIRRESSRNKQFYKTTQVLRQEDIKKIQKIDKERRKKEET